MMGILFYGLFGALTIGAAYLVKTEVPAPWDVSEGSGGAPGIQHAWGRRHAPSRRSALNGAALLFLFAALTGLAALRIDVGNDYGSYVNTFHEIFVGGYVVTEPGFNLLVRLLYTLSGGENYLLVFGVFAAATTALFLKAMYDQSLDFSLSFALFMLLGLYFRTFNTVRYYFVLAVTLYSLRYVLKREYGKFILLILGAALFHKSVLVVIPLYLIALLPWKKWQVAVGAALAVSLPLFQDFWMTLLLKLYPSYQNTVYLEQGTGLEGSLMGIVRCAAVLLLGAFGWKAVKESEANRFYFKLNLLGLALYTCASFVPLVSRLGYYLITPHLLLVPGILCAMKKGGGKKTSRRTVLYGAVLVFSILYFGIFLLTAHQVGVRVLPYHTWVFTEREWLNGSYIF
ncbi:MAG TPA: EpsG family protein [Candidatus Eisenbergiella merdavium]|uniref:EpsG family protein n=1 Tax=Candidatus Eisenbergiella merdavium TaxID=2838551 RepID=A0A9D2NCJ6_9FIRM|nr:EpsG family protein [Candidatus Eisenbergiella merdavium]